MVCRRGVVTVSATAERQHHRRHSGTCRGIPSRQGLSQQLRPNLDSRRWRLNDLRDFNRPRTSTSRARSVISHPRRGDRREDHGVDRGRSSTPRAAEATGQRDAVCVERLEQLSCALRPPRQAQSDTATFTGVLHAQTDDHTRSTPFPTTTIPIRHWAKRRKHSSARAARHASRST